MCACMCVYMSMFMFVCGRVRVCVYMCMHACIMCVCSVENKMPTSATSSILVPPAGEAMKIGPPADLREVKKRVGQREEKRRRK